MPITAGLHAAVHADSWRLGNIARSLLFLASLDETPQAVGSRQYTAYPMGKGSGSVTTFACADGFITIDRHEEIVEARTRTQVTLLSRDLTPADLVVIGSHCVGLDLLLTKMKI